VEAVAERYPDRNIVACFELHTFSSLNKNFLPFYKGSLEKASRAIVYFNPGQFEQKRLEPFSPNTVKEGFGGNNLTVFNNSSGLMDHIKNIKLKSPVWLFMSSGDFGGCNLKMLAEELLA